jgi:competence ComEA-like helix-hairpin-helix protein
VNRQERAVILLLAATLIAGAGILQYKHARLRRFSSISLHASLSSPPSCSSPAPIDLNRATKSQLDVLPGIGPVLAGRIIEYRQRQGGFHNVSELRAVTGIGPKRYASLRDLVVVGSPHTGAVPDSGR